MSRDWKRQFYRVKQQTAQNLGRAERSEVLSNELQTLERRIEATRHLCMSTVKRAQACLISQNGDVDKRTKKTPMYALFTSLQDSAKFLGEESLMGQISTLTSEAQQLLVSALVKYEIILEQSVILPLQNVLDNEIFKIQKLRKQLTKLTLDMDSVRNRLNGTQRQANNSGNIASSASKMDKIQEEHDDVCHRVQTCKDQLSTEMYQFIILENSISEIYATFIREQMEYHRCCLDILAQTLPEIHERQKSLCQISVYGQSLKQNLKHSKGNIANVIELCVCTILQVGMKEEGLFRINGSVSRLKKLRAALNCNLANMEEYIHDIPCVASALKQYIRELPEPLMTFELYEQWVQAAYLKDHGDKIEMMQGLISSLPIANYDNLRYLTKFFAKFAENVEYTKMNINNLAIVIGPNLLWSKDEDAHTQMFKATAQATVVDCLISNADILFPGDIEFMEGSEGSPCGTVTSLHDISCESIGDHRGLILNQVNTSSMSSVITSLDSSNDSYSGSGNPSPTAARRAKKQAPAPPLQRLTTGSPSPAKLTSKPSIRPLSNLDLNRARPVAPPPAPPPTLQKSTANAEKPSTSPKPKFTKSTNPFDDEEDISPNTNL